MLCVPLRLPLRHFAFKFHPSIPHNFANRQSYNFEFLHNVVFFPVRRIGATKL